MSDLKPCPFCGSVRAPEVSDVGECEECSKFDDCGRRLENRTCEGCDRWERPMFVVCNYNISGCGASGPYRKTKAEAIAAWNSRAAKPCYAADANYERCKYGVNRGWCDDAPFLVWDDTGHLFITMGGLKTWDVTDDARKWSAAHGTLTAEQVREAVMSADRWKKPMGNTGLKNTHLIIRDDGWQAIADELNDVWNSRAERTCHIEERYGNQYCTCCGEMVGTWDSASELCISGNAVELWNYCPSCGCKILRNTSKCSETTTEVVGE